MMLVMTGTCRCSMCNLKQTCKRKEGKEIRRCINLGYQREGQAC
jgi:hypothetical protein